MLVQAPVFQMVQSKKARSKAASIIIFYILHSIARLLATSGLKTFTRNTLESSKLLILALSTALGYPKKKTPAA
jgi:hypothetical protein